MSFPDPNERELIEALNEADELRRQLAEATALNEQLRSGRDQLAAQVGVMRDVMQDIVSKVETMGIFSFSLYVQKQCDAILSLTPAAALEQLEKRAGAKVLKRLADNVLDKDIRRWIRDQAAKLESKQ